MDDATLMEHIREAIKSAADPLHSQIGRIDSLLRGSYSDDEPGIIDVLRSHSMRLKACEETIEQPKEWLRKIIGISITCIIGVAATGVVNSCQLKNEAAETARGKP